MAIALWLFGSVIVLAALGFACRALLDNPRGDLGLGLIWHAARLYSVLVHRVRVVGREHAPGNRNAGPLILVANHTAGVDPVLIQAALPFEIRWLMAQDMRHPWGEWLWDLTRIIFVSRDAPSPAGTREAIQHLRDGGVLGVFPEGGIERPRGVVRPFLPGIGFLIRRTGAPVLPVVVEGTPDADAAWGSLYKPSRATVTFMRPIDYRDSGLDTAGITEDLRRRFIAWVEGPSEEPARTLAIDAQAHERARLRRARA